MLISISLLRLPGAELKKNEDGEMCISVPVEGVMTRYVNRKGKMDYILRAYMRYPRHHKHFDMEGYMAIPRNRLDDALMDGSGVRPTIFCWMYSDKRRSIEESSMVFDEIVD